MSAPVCDFCGKDDFAEILLVSEITKKRLCAPCVRAMAVKLQAIYEAHAPQSNEKDRH